MRQKGKICFIAFLLFPQVAWGTLWITEIHYNPTGTDSGYEWIEVWNDTDEIVDLENYTFREGGVNHGLKAFQGGTEIAEHEYAVIADKPNNFLEKHPKYQGVIIDSSFSLSNSGELLEITDSDGNVHFSMTYDPASGGDGNGASIGLIEDIWQEVAASPGSRNIMFATSSTETESSEIDTDVELPKQTTVAVDFSPATYIEIKNPHYKEKTIKVDAGGDRVVMAGVAYWFHSQVYGLEGVEIQDPEVRWNWGDGNTGSGAVDVHTYHYPGTYTLSASAKVINYSARDRALVTVIEPSLVLDMHSHRGEHLVSLHNTSPYHLELSGYVLAQTNHTFTFPPDSFIAPGQELVISEEALGFVWNLTEEVHLQDGNNTVIDSLLPAQRILAEQLAHLQNETSEHTTGEAQAQEQEVLSAGTHSVVYVEAEVDKKDEPESKKLATVPLPQADVVFQEAQLVQVQSSLPWHWVAVGIVLFAMAGLYVHHSTHRHKRSTLETAVDDAVSPITTRD